MFEAQSPSHTPDPLTEPPGSRDGQGAGDHDLPYSFGRRPTCRAPFPFTERQFARLLILRSRIEHIG
jgi:hypothetical protein